MKTSINFVVKLFCALLVYIVKITHNSINCRDLQLELLGSKDLGTNVFRTLMCIVGKP